MNLTTPRRYRCVEGCLPFLTFAQKALLLHHTTFQDRKINVELTSGGGGTSSLRRKRIRDKNFQLTKQRREAVIFESSPELMVMQYQKMMEEVREGTINPKYQLPASKSQSMVRMNVVV